MPPPGTKGMGKKGAGAISRQRSRNTTPISLPPPSSAKLPPTEEVDTEYLQVAAKLHLFRPITYDDLVDSTPASAPIPDSRTLDAVITRLKEFGELIEKRSLFSDFAMRAIAQARSQELQHSSAHMESGQKGALKKKRKATEQPAAALFFSLRQTRPSQQPFPAQPNSLSALQSFFHLAYSTSPADQVNWRLPLERSRSPHQHHLGKNPRKYGRTADAESSSSSLSPAGSPTTMNVDEKKAVEDDSESSSDEEGRPPERAKPASHTFGDDPSTFPDPTVYEIRDTTPRMTDDEKREIYSVARFPKSDLAELIAGEPPDKDFSNAKPSNQISFSTFSTYVEPFFRPFNDEDLAFLRERSDRVTPFTIPKRGKKHYLEVWAEEEGSMNIDSSPRGDKLPPNQPRGNIDHLDDDVAETDKLSVPPLLSRMLAAMRPEHRAVSADERPAMATNGVNGGEPSIVNGGDLDTAMADPPPLPLPAIEDPKSNLPPATYMPESSSENFKKGIPMRLEYANLDERLRMELQHVGFLSTEEDPPADYDAQYDDEVCARLRLLQEKLRQQVLVNGARKARLTELVKERMAFQEYTTILEDLDGQVQSAYLKRTRTIGKSKKKSRPGASAAATAAAAAQSTARPGIGDLTRTLMERRRKWIDVIGPVFDGETLTKVPRSNVKAEGGGVEPETAKETSIFGDDVMREWKNREQQAWDEEQEEE
ncbi:hypothetical protein MKZ38_000025 [Zalerion maritima]|uniref:Uncharacterized protein n=1 Tax=Zalerion maritima TaxID=339359 RepID=A0AAD5RTA7_9PEZI|nr:hypothetical protein MKZ38_000025 [Zalerion maritima]